MQNAKLLYYRETIFIDNPFEEKASNLVHAQMHSIYFN